jgi:hypothetical protein
MKTVLPALLLCLICSSTIAQTDTLSNANASTEKKYSLIDLSTGETIDVYYDTLSWTTVNRVTTKPVDYYIIRYTDVSMMPDTVHGVTGIIVNDLIRKTDAGWAFDDARVKWDGKELKMKDKYGRKVKWEQGSLKIKDWNSKYKSEKGDDAKYKEEWDKIKWKDDELKTEIGTRKTKTKQ